jgi:hypothetical protein
VNVVLLVLAVAIAAFCGMSVTSGLSRSGVGPVASILTGFAVAAFIGALLASLT